MPRFLVFSIILSVLLTACASSAPVSPAETMVVETPDVSEVPPPVAVAATTAIQPETNPTDSMPVVEATPTQLSSAAPAEYLIEASESSVSYEVGETFFNQNNRFNVAVGVTNVVNGSIQLDPQNPKNTTLSTITVDISQFQSDSGRRDNAIRDRFLESRRFPMATFVPTQISGLPEQYTAGETLAFQMTGDLTVRETTRPVTFDVQASLNEGILTGQAVTTILMSDFGFGPIQMAGVLGTEDEVKINFEFVARPVN